MVPTIDHFLGQDSVIKRFKVALEAAWADCERLPHMLLVGPPGVGKTELAHVAAREMGVTLHERLSQVLCCLGSLNGLLLRAQDKDVVFLDELHELPPAMQTALYQCMERQQLSVRTRDEQTFHLPVKNFTLIGATTDEFRLLRPLRDRFKMVLPFSSYDVPSLAKITAQRAQLEGIIVDNEVCEEIARRAKGTPRLAIRILESCQRYVRSVGDCVIDLRRFAEAMAIDG